MFTDGSIRSYVESQGTDDVTGTVGTTGAEMLITNITDTRSMLSDISVDLPVGTADAGAYFNEKLLSSVDYGVRLQPDCLTLSRRVYVSPYSLTIIFPDGQRAPLVRRRQHR